MLKRVRAAVAVVSLVLVSTAAGASVALADPASHQVREHSASKVTFKCGVTLASSAKQVEEGDRLTLTASVASPKQAARVTLQKWYVPAYYGTPAWQTVKTVLVGGRKAVKFHTVATYLNNERYRVSLTYKHAKPVTSKPVNLTVWRWIPLSEYTPYYTTGGTMFGTTILNGNPYTGWGASSASHTGAWESRFTPGRHCKTFRGVIGVADISGDGSSGTINFTADDEIIYQSPSLTPGMDEHVNIPLSKPYRFGIQLFDTTPGGTTGKDTIESWPVIGDPALLCTGV